MEEAKANLSPALMDKVKPLGGDPAKEWVGYALQQALIAPKTVLKILESAISITTSRLHQIKSTSSTHLQLASDSLQELKSEYKAYEDILFGKLKEAVCFAAAHPFATSGVVVSSGVLVVKRTRHALYCKSLRLFLSEEAMLCRATTKVQNLRDSVRHITEEGKKLESLSLAAEAELKRGRKKLRQAGKQIHGVISTAYMIERESVGLKDILKELPKRDASQFRSRVWRLASEAKGERSVVNKEEWVNMPSLSFHSCNRKSGFQIAIVLLHNKHKDFVALRHDGY